MAEVFDRAKRSDVMSRIRGRANASTELAMLSAMRTAKVKGWRRHVLMRPLVHREDLSFVSAGKRGRISLRPDFVFHAERLVVYVDGCFWHGCPIHATKPAQNAAFWETKLSKNVTRDSVQTRALEATGWTVLRVWEHELAAPKQVVRKLVVALRAAKNRRDKRSARAVRFGL